MSRGRLQACGGRGSKAHCEGDLEQRPKGGEGLSHEDA